MQVEAARLRKEQEVLDQKAEALRLERDRARQQRKKQKEAGKVKKKALDAGPAMSSATMLSTPVRPNSTVVLESTPGMSGVVRPPARKKAKKSSTKEDWS